MVLTRTGYKAIETLVLGEEVFTHKLRWRPIVELHKTRKRIRIVRGHGHPGLACSAEHPFYTRTRSELRVKKGQRLSPRWQLSDLEWTQASALSKQHYWATPTDFPADVVPPVGGRGMPLDTHLLWLAGRYVGDGWTRLTKTRAELVIICGKHEAEELGAYIEAVWPRYGSRSETNELAWNNRTVRTAVQYTANHRGLVTWLREHFGHGAGAKRIPAWLLGLDETLRQAFLAGYVSADGYRARTTWEASTVSKALAFGIKALACSLGKTVTVNTESGQNHVIEGRQVNTRQLWRIHWREDTDPMHRHTMRDGGFDWCRVREVVTTGKAETVFNIGVEEDESYVVEGIVVHNCRHHSRARGGGLVSPRVRSLARVAIPWAKLPKPQRPRLIGLENVSEFMTWGPVMMVPGTEDNPQWIPNPDKAGQYFDRFVADLRGQGYHVDWRVLNAADYGAPTSRKRFVLLARADGKAPNWPAPTHGEGRRYPWRTAAECIDWSLPTTSIFDRTRPLAEATQRRIAEGFVKYVLTADTAAPNKTVSTWVSKFYGTAGAGDSVHKPLTSISAQGQHHALCSVKTAWVAKHYTGIIGHGLDRPLGTITTRDHHSLCVATQGDENKQDRVIAWIERYYSRGGHSASLDLPLPTITTKGRMSLIVARIREMQIVDIGMRMFSPRELALCQGFPEDYVLLGTATQQIHRIGNSVPPQLVDAVLSANQDAYTDPRNKRTKQQARPLTCARRSRKF